MTLTPQEVHEIKLTLTRLEKETPEQWAVGLIEDDKGRRCLLGHLLLSNQFTYSFRHGLLSRLVEDEPLATKETVKGLATLNNNLGGNKRKILDALWGLLKGVG